MLCKDCGYSDGGMCTNGDSIYFGQHRTQCRKEPCAICGKAAKARITHEIGAHKAKIDVCMDCYKQIGDYIFAMRRKHEE